jgi:hypothetical protein
VWVSIDSVLTCVPMVWLIVTQDDDDNDDDEEDEEEDEDDEGLDGVRA